MVAPFSCLLSLSLSLSCFQNSLVRAVFQPQPSRISFRHISSMEREDKRQFENHKQNQILKKKKKDRQSIVAISNQLCCAEVCPTYLAKYNCCISIESLFLEILLTYIIRVAWFIKTKCFPCFSHQED